jgi:hypothetical protein
MAWPWSAWLWIGACCLLAAGGVRWAVRRVRRRREQRALNHFQTILLEVVDDYRLPSAVPGLYRQGWRAHHVPLLKNVLREAFDDDRSVALMPILMTLAHRPAALAGAAIEAQIDWLTVLVQPPPDRRGPVHFRLPLLPGPLGVEEDEMGDAVFLHDLPERLAPVREYAAHLPTDIAPLAFALKITLPEAVRFAREGTLTRDRLVGMAVLRGLPTPPEHPGGRQPGRRGG